MKIIPLLLPEVMLIRPEIYVDKRGFFAETYRTSDFEKMGLPNYFVQQNHSGSHQEVLRGLHYQIRQSQDKLVQVIIGEVYEVAVDIRSDSSTFGRWVGVNMSAKEHDLLWIPKGFAHGFYTLSEWAEVIYHVTTPYSPKWERTILWNDDEIGISWPLLNGKAPLLSEKDSCGKCFSESEIYNEIGFEN